MESKDCNGCNSIYVMIYVMMSALPQALLIKILKHIQQLLLW